MEIKCPKGRASLDVHGSSLQVARGRKRLLSETLPKEHRDFAEFTAWAHRR